MTERVDELEVKIAFLENALNELSEEFYRQQKEFADLKQQYLKLIEKLRDIQGTDTAPAEVIDERPPHY